MFKRIFIINLIYMLSSVDCRDELTTDETPVDYSQHKLIKIFPKITEDLSRLNKLRDEYKVCVITYF